MGNICDYHVSIFHRNNGSLREEENVLSNAGFDNHYANNLDNTSDLESKIR